MTTRSVRGSLLFASMMVATIGLLAPAHTSSSLAAQDPAAPSPPSQPGFDFAGNRESIFDAFYSTGIDTATPFAVVDVAIRKDNMTLLLKQGTLFFMKPIAGEVTGAAFIGTGEAIMSPPNRTERYMLRKYSGADALKEPFTEAVFRFTDGTDAMLRAAVKTDPAGATQAAHAEDMFKDRNQLLNGTRFLNLEMQFLENRLSGLKGKDAFLGDLHTLQHDWLTYRYNPQEINENSLSTSETLGAKGRRYEVTWTEWHKQTDYDKNGHYVLMPERDGPRVLHVQNYDMTLNLPTLGRVEWEARMRVEPLIDDIAVLHFDLANNSDYGARWYEERRPVKLVSVTDETGAPLTYLHRKDQLLILLPRRAAIGKPLSITVKGTAEVVYELTAESFGLMQVPWYPKYGYGGGRSSFHWTVRVPKAFLVTGSGKFVREFDDKDANMKGLETQCDLQVDFPWAIFGRFQKSASVFTSAEDSRSIGLTIHSFPNMTFSITDPDILDQIGATQPVTIILTAPQKKVAGMFDEGKEILKLYEKIYGAYPYDELHIAQMGPFLGFGQSPQGFVQLTGEAFMSQAKIESDVFHGFFAHEIAHQWWGHQVSNSSGDDEWISESFAEYASGIFVKEFQGPKRFQRTLDEWRRRAKRSDKEGPIAAANTMSGPNGGLYRTDLLYYKGPYVLHMLRLQLDDEKYMKVMRTIQETYKNQNISTEMLLQVVNRVSGTDYTWFFDQWFWDVGIPTFRYSWRSEKQPDGKFLITVHVSQDDKANVKRVLMPVYIHFKDKTIPQFKPVVQADQDIKMLSPVEPKDVTLDDDRTLLAEVVK
jgi:Peptidase family M1 domain